MSNPAKLGLYWTPRAVSVLFLMFLSLFALDELERNGGFWTTALGLLMHLTPVLILSAALILAWRWEWVGAVLYGGAAALYVGWMGTRPWPIPVRLIDIAIIAGPAAGIAVLFLWNWMKRDELRIR